MARINIDSTKVQGKLVLDLTSQIQKVRANIARVCNIMDFTRAGADFTALGTALGCSAADAEILYGRYRAIETTMNGTNFTNLSDVDQG